MWECLLLKLGDFILLQGEGALFVTKEGIGHEYRKILTKGIEDQGGGLLGSDFDLLQGERGALFFSEVGLDKNILVKQEVGN